MLNRTGDDVVACNKAHAEEIIPALGQMPVAEMWGGIMPFSADGRPIIGKLGSQKGLYICTGLGGSGFCRGPASGLLLSAFISEQEHVKGRSMPTNNIPFHLLDFTDPSRFGSKI